jgi:hypothetical protein
MSELLRVSSVLVVLVVYRITAIVAGLALCFLGYKLFVLGVYEKAGELKAAWGNHLLTLKQAAPGTFFALFGAFVMSLSLVRGITIDQLRQVASSTEQSVSSSPAVREASRDGIPSQNGGLVRLPAGSVAPRTDAQESSVLPQDAPPVLVFPNDLGGSDEAVKAIVEKTRTGPLTPDEYRKLRDWVGEMQMIHIQAKAPDRPGIVVRHNPS